MSDFIRTSRLGVRKFLVTMESFFQGTFLSFVGVCGVFFTNSRHVLLDKDVDKVKCMGSGQIKTFMSQIPRSSSSFMTSNFSNLVLSPIRNFDYQKKIYKMSKASDFSHSKVSIWWGSFKSHKENDDQMTLVCFLLMGSGCYRTGATECRGSLLFVRGNFLCKNELCPGHFEN